MALRAVFFDIGQTLIREIPSRFAIYADTARRRGLEVEDGSMRRLMLEAHHELPRRLEGSYRYDDVWFAAFIDRIFGSRLGLPSSAVEEVTEELFERFEAPETFEVFDGAFELLADLRTRGLALGVISNWSARLPKLLRTLDLDRPFDFVLCSALEQMEKPEPEIFEAALARAGVAPGEALHIGDHPEKDVAGARRVGLQAVRIDHDRTAEGDDPDVVGSLPELGAYILERT